MLVYIPITLEGVRNGSISQWFAKTYFPSNDCHNWLVVL